MLSHKLKVFDDKKKTADKAIDFLLAYDSNAKGELMAQDSKGVDIMQDRVLARALCGAKVAVEVSVWKMTDKETKEERSGNYVSKVMPTLNNEALKKAVIEEHASDTTDYDDVPF